MRSVGTKNTGPEMSVRRWLHAQGYRYRLHQKTLAGTPDIVFPSRKKAIFVHGCFWHSHGCLKGKAPKSRSDYWAPKLEKNRLRDAFTLEELKASGWQTHVVWACELSDMDELGTRLKKFLHYG